MQKSRKTGMKKSQVDSEFKKTTPDLSPCLVTIITGSAYGQADVTCCEYFCYDDSGNRFIIK